MPSVFSASSFAATPVSYTAISLSWENPPQGVNLRLIRNSYGVSADRDDGLALFEQSITGTSSFVDNTLSLSLAGQFIYYTLWNIDSGGNWWRSADVQCIFPKDWGYAGMLQSWLPAYLFDLDALLLGDPIT